MKTLFALLVFLWIVLVPAPVRAQTPADVSGKWHFVFDTQDGSRVFDPVFEQQGSKVTGKWDGSDVQGTFENNALNLEFQTTSEEVGKGTLVIKGKLYGDKLTGSWSFQTYDGSFQATRTK